MLTLLQSIWKRLTEVFLKVTDIEKSLAAIVASQKLQTAKLMELELGFQNLSSALVELGNKQDLIAHDVGLLVSAVLPRPAERITFNCVLEGIYYSEVDEMLIKATQMFVATIQPVDAKGNPALVDGMPTWASSNPLVLTVEPAADGLSAMVKAVGPVGTGQVSVQGDADLGEGQKLIIGTLDVEVTPGDAVTFIVQTGAVSEQA